MARSIEIVLPADKTEALLARLRTVPGVVGVAVQRGGSLAPAGDILTLHASNDATRPVFRLLAELQVVEQGGAVSSSELSSLLPATGQQLVRRESSETVWEEIATLFEAQADLSLNFCVMMLLSGGVAAVGFWSNQSGLIYASQLLAPHFEALLRIPFGLVSGAPGATSARGAGHARRLRAAGGGRGPDVGAAARPRPRHVRRP